MATTYKYNFVNVDDVVRFNVTPDFSVGYAPGDTFTITGKSRTSGYRTRTVRIEFHDSDAYGSKATMKFMINVNIAAGKSGSFTQTFQIPADAGSSLPNRITRMYVYPWLSDSVDADAGGFEVFHGLGTANVDFIKYRLNPQIYRDAVFQRCDASGNITDNGTRILCQKLRISINDKANKDASVITRCTVSVSAVDDSGSTTTTSITNSQLTAMLNGGYSESTPTLLSRVTNIRAGMKAATSAAWALVGRNQRRCIGQTRYLTQRKPIVN